MRVKQMMVALAAMTMLSATAQADFIGTGTVSEVSGWFAAGSNVTVTATAGDNSEFSSWSGDTDEADIQNGEITFTVNEAMRITATFAHIFHDIEATAGSGGSIDPAGTISVPQGEDQAFTITPADNHHIAQLLVDSEPVTVEEGSYTFENVMQAHTIEASFAINTYEVTFDLGEHGNHTGGGDLVQTVEHGSAADEPEFTVSDSHTFIGWDTAFDNVTEDMTVTAQYQIKSYTLTYTAGDNGTVTGDLEQTVNHGSAGDEVTAVPADGYQFVKWSDDRTDNPRTDVNVTADVNVEASFALNMYSFTVSSEHGDPTPSTTNFAHGDEVNFSMPEHEIVVGVTTQYVATGWVGTGSLEDGTGTSGSFVIEEDTTINWQWSTNYWIDFTIQGE